LNQNNSTPKFKGHTHLSGFDIEVFGEQHAENEQGLFAKTKALQTKKGISQHSLARTPALKYL